MMATATHGGDSRYLDILDHVHEMLQPGALADRLMVLREMSQQPPVSYAQILEVERRCRRASPAALCNSWRRRRTRRS